MDLTFYEVKSWVMAGLLLILTGALAYFLKNEHSRTKEAERKADISIKEITTMFTDAMLGVNKAISELTVVIKDLELKMAKEYVTVSDFEKTTARLEKDITGVGDRFQREMDKCANRKVCD